MALENNMDPRQRFSADLARGNKADAVMVLQHELVNNPNEAMNLIRLAQRQQQQGRSTEQVYVANDGTGLVIMQDAYSRTLVGRLPLSSQIPIGGYQNTTQLAAMTNRGNLGGRQQYQPMQQYRTSTNPNPTYATNPNSTYSRTPYTGSESTTGTQIQNPNLTNPNLAYENTTGTTSGTQYQNRHQRPVYATGNANIGNSNVGNSNIGNSNVGNSNVGNTNLGNNANNIGNKNLGNNYLNTQNTNQGNNYLNTQQVTDSQGNTHNYNRNNSNNRYNNQNGYNPALAFGVGVGVGALENQYLQNRYLNNQLENQYLNNQYLNSQYLNNGYDNGYINGGVNNGYDNGYINGGVNNGYDNGYINGGVNNGYDNGYVNGGVNNNGFDNANAIVQRLAFDLQNGNQDDAANLIRRELNFNPRQALAEMHQANMLAGPDSPDRIRRLNDGTVVVTDSYSQTQEFAGQLPSPQIALYNQQRNGYDGNYNGGNRQPVYNGDNQVYDGNYNGVNRQPVRQQPIYDGNNGNYNGVNRQPVRQQPIYDGDNGNYDGNYNRQPVQQPIYDGLNNGYDQGAVINPNQGIYNGGQYQQNYMQHARALAFDLQSGRQNDAAFMLRNDLRMNPQQALNEIRMANQMAGINSPERIETSRNGDILIRDRYTGRSEFVGRLPGAPIGNYYNGANNGYYNGANNGYYNGANNGYYNGIGNGQYLGGAAITGVTAGLTAGLIGSALRRGGRH